MICNNSEILFLRPIEEKDLPLIQKWRNLKEIQAFVREYREMSGKHVSTWYESMILDKRFEFFMVEDLNQKPIGVTGLTYIDWVNKNADIHLAIYEHNWIDEKFAPEVLKVMLDYGFNHLNMHRIYAEVYEIDLKKIDFFLENGFHRDAVLRDHYYHEGRYINSHIYSVLKDN